MELTLLDYKILEFVSKHDSAKKAEILKRFSSKDPVEYRLVLLSKPECRDSTRQTIKNSNYLEELGDVIQDEIGNETFETRDEYRVTDKGRTAVKNYHDQEQYKFRLELRSAIIAMIFSIITAAITTAIIDFLKTP